MSDRAVLVPLTDTVTARATIDYAIEWAEAGTVHIVVALSADTQTPEGRAELDRARALLEQAQAWISETVRNGDLDVRVATLAEDEYLFGPEEYAALFGAYSEEHGIQDVVVDPEYWADTVGPMLASFEAALEREGLHVEEAPVARPARHERLGGRGTPAKMIALFGVSYGFYLILGDPTYWFDVVTGAVVAALVAITLGNVTFARAPRFPRSIYRNVRFGLYVPYLVWEIVKANIAIAIVILHPRLPIAPQLTRVEAKVPGGLPLLALANSITLTPGTLTVRGNDQRLIVHTLRPEARDDLFDGRLERAVRFVFYGRRYARIATPRERGDTEVLQGVERP